MLKNSDAISDPDTLDWNLDPTLRIQIQAEYELFLVRNIVRYFVKQNFNWLKYYFL